MDGPRKFLQYFFQDVIITKAGKCGVSAGTEAADEIARSIVDFRQLAGCTAFAEAILRC